MAGSPGFRNIATRLPARLPQHLATPAWTSRLLKCIRQIPHPHSCAMNIQLCFKALSGIGRMHRFGESASGVSTRFRRIEDQVRKLGAFGTWLCWVLLIGLGVSPAAMAQTTVTYIHTDALGSVVAESDANGNVIKRYDYEPYGAVVGGEVTDGPGYTGHVSDSATGLSYMQQRYYDPLMGRFLSLDPVAPDASSGGKFNRFAYALGNPYKFVDPDGRDEERAYGVGVAIALRNSPEKLETVRQAEMNAGRGHAVAGIEGGKGIVEAVRAVADGGGMKEAVAAAGSVGGAVLTGRAKNKLGPNTAAVGPHSTFKTDSKGNVTNTATYSVNPKNPSGYQEVKRVDVTGSAHHNPDGTKVPTPHVSEAGVKGVRPARQDELPRRN